MSDGAISMMAVDRKKWDRRFLALAAHCAGWSKDPSTKVGAVIVDNQRRVVGLGYNGFPRYVDDTEARYDERSVKYKLIVHSEANAILNANIPVAGCTIYSTKFPCSDCTKLIIQSGIGVVVSPKPLPDEVWTADSEFSKQMLAEACIHVIEVDE